MNSEAKRWGSEEAKKQNWNFIWQAKKQNNPHNKPKLKINTNNEAKGWRSILNSEGKKWGSKEAYIENQYQTMKQKGEDQYWTVKQQKDEEARSKEAKLKFHMTSKEAK